LAFVIRKKSPDSLFWGG